MRIAPRNPSGYHLVNDTTNIAANAPFIAIRDIRTYVRILAYEYSPMLPKQEQMIHEMDPRQKYTHTFHHPVARKAASRLLRLSYNPNNMKWSNTKFQSLPEKWNAQPPLTQIQHPLRSPRSSPSTSGSVHRGTGAQAEGLWSRPSNTCYEPRLLLARKRMTLASLALSCSFSLLTFPKSPDVHMSLLHAHSHFA